MNAYSSIFLGILQGLTEFLPVSSSGHLVVAQKIIPGFTQPGVLFDVVLHAGTLLSILFYFRRNLIELTRKYFWVLVVGTLPAVILGLLLESSIDVIFENTTLVGIAFLITALFNYLVDKTKEKKTKLTWINSLYIGVAQAIAIVPGISRSGSTIYAGSYLGLKKEKAAEFSFLLSVPAVLGANILQFLKHGTQAGGNFAIYFLGFLTSFFTGYLAIKMVYKALAKKRFKYFSLYLVAVSVLVLIFL